MTEWAYEKAWEKHKSGSKKDKFKSPKTIQTIREYGAQLHYASSKGNIKHIIQLLQDQYDDVNSTCRAAGDKGFTPLHEASDAGQVQAVKRLLVAKAEVDVEDAAKDTPLVLAKRKGHQEVIEVLERCNKPEQDRRQVLQKISSEFKQAELKEQEEALYKGTL